MNNFYTIVYNQLKKHDVNITIFSVYKYVFLASILTLYDSFNMHFKTEVFQTRNLLKYILYNYISERNEFIVVQYQVRFYNVNAWKYI